MIVEAVNASHLERLIASVSCPEDSLDLARASLLVACEEYPQLDVDGYHARLAELGARFAARSCGAAPEDRCCSSASSCSTKRASAATPTTTTTRATAS